MISQVEIKALNKILSENEKGDIKIARHLLYDIVDYFKKFGWNSVGNGNEPIGKPLIVTVKDNLQGKPNELRYPVYYVKSNTKGQYVWKWIYGDMIYDLSPEESEVIAWKLLTETYSEDRI